MKNIAIILVLTNVITLTMGMRSVSAQLKGDKLLGTSGLDAGTQLPAETFTLALPVYVYNATSLRKLDGEKAPVNPDLTMFLLGIGGSYVSNLKILGANYGATVLIPFATNRIQGNDIDSRSRFGLSDIYIQPFQLGWHVKKINIGFSYGLYVPTGRFEVGGDDNAGLGMIGNEFSSGISLPVDEKNNITFSTLLSYEIHGKKKGTDIKTGDIFSAEGGIGKTWYTFKGNKIPSSVIKAGVVYYIQFKTSEDRIPIDNKLLTPGKDKIYALGLESNLLLIKSKFSIGARWLGEFGAQNRFQGNTFLVTFAQVFSTKRD